MNILLVILVFVTFASSTPIRCQDAYTPNPFIAGQVTTVHIGGKATATIEKVRCIRLRDIMRIIKNSNFCEEIVIPSGFR